MHDVASRQFIFPADGSLEITRRPQKLFLGLA